MVSVNMEGLWMVCDRKSLEILFINNHREPLRTTYWEPLRSIDSHWEPLTATGNHWNHWEPFEPLETIENHKKPLRTTGITGCHWEPLGTTENHWQPLVTIGTAENHWKPLRTTGKHWEPLGTIENYWNHWLPLRSVGTTGNHLKSLRTTGNHWEPLESLGILLLTTIGNHWEPLESLGILFINNHREALRTTGSHWNHWERLEPLGIIENHWTIENHLFHINIIINILTMRCDQCQNVELFSGRWTCILLFIMGDNFYIQINCTTFGMWIFISKCRNTFGMTNSISKWRDTFGMTNSISKFEYGDLWPARSWCALYGTFHVRLSGSVFGTLQGIVSDLPMNDDGREIQLGLSVEEGWKAGGQWVTAVCWSLWFSNAQAKSHQYVNLFSHWNHT